MQTSYSDSLVIPASLERLGDVHRWAEDHLKRLPITEEKQYEILLSLSEVVTNAIRHGCSCNEKEPITINIEKNHQAFCITVLDTGNGFDPNVLPDPTKPERLLEPSGRGVFLLKSLADEVRFDFSAGTAVTAVFRFMA